MSSYRSDNDKAVSADTEISPRFPLTSVAAYRNRIYFGIATAIESVLRKGGRAGAVLRWLRFGIRGLLLGLTPPAEEQVSREVKRHNIVGIWLAAFIFAFVFSFVLNALFSLDAGTFGGSEGARKYFWDDWHNKIIYSIAAPLYVAFSIVAIYASFKWISVRIKLGDGSSSASGLSDIFRMALVASLLVGAAGAVQVSYFKNNVMLISSEESRTKKPATLNDSCIKQTYWFLDDVRPGGPAGEPSAWKAEPQRYLNSAGIYYFVSQFLRMLIVFTAVVCFGAAAIEMWKFGLRLDGRLSPTAKAVEDAQTMVHHYTIVEIAMKGLAGALTFHMAVWGDSCLEGSNNIRLAAAAVFAIGFVLLMVPRQFVEHRLLQWMVRNNLRDRNGGEWPSLVFGPDVWTTRIITWGFWAILGYLFVYTGVIPYTVRWILRMLGFAQL